MSDEDNQETVNIALENHIEPHNNNYMAQVSNTNFLNLLVKPVSYDYKLKKFYSRKTPHEAVTFEIDDIHRFRNSLSISKTGQSTLQSLSGSRSSSMRDFIKKRQFKTEVESKYLKSSLGPQDSDVCYPIDIVEWEKDVEFWNELQNTKNEGISKPLSEPLVAVHVSESKENDSWDEEKDHTDRKQPFHVSEASPDTVVDGFDSLEHLVNNSVLVKEYVNGLLASNWEKDVFYDEKSPHDDYLILHVDDPNLIFEKNEEKKKNKNKRKTIIDKLHKNKYNISNDKYYLSEGKKVSLGTFGVQHSLTSLRLDDRFYRVNLSRDELRNLHKPSIILENKEFKFITNLINNDKNSKKKNSKKGTELQTEMQLAFSEQNFRRGSELSLCDQAPFYVFEYSEEMPFFIVKPGMVSLLNKYYRASDTGDDMGPEGCITLDNDDENPFFGFGDIRPGSFVQTLTNNLFIAPVFPHKVSDYLCIIQDNGVVVRPFDSVFLIGQEFTKEEVFAPHSRKLNQFCKDRLKAAAHRTFAKGKHLLMSDLDSMFPYFSEGSKRKWLKEYADCVKKGRDNVWVLREAHHLLNEEDVRKLVTPEHICQYESMLACETKMQMMGLRCSENEDDDMDTGRFCPNWSLSRNFVNAANGRGLLELNNKNDENDAFFNFRRVKLKKGNEAENRRILSEHQASYKERISRIWNKHMDFLSSTEAPEYIPVDILPKAPVESETVDESNVLIIKRTYNERGIQVKRIEKIYDSKVIRAYLRAREKTVVEKKGSLTCSNCGQSGHMKTNKTCPNYTNVIKNTKKKFANDKRRAKSFLQESMSRLLTKFFNIPFSNAFHRPVSTKKFPNYPLIIKNPIDFGTIRVNVRNFKYKKFEAFVDEFYLMLENCKAYNGPSHSLTEIAENIYRQASAFATENAQHIAENEALIDDEMI